MSDRRYKKKGTIKVMKSKGNENEREGKATLGNINVKEEHREGKTTGRNSKGEEK